jgi:hypothetical protein
MTDASFGSSFQGPTSVGGAPLSPAQAPDAQSAADPAQAAPSQGIFGSGLAIGPFGQPKFTPPDPEASALDNTANQLQQHIQQLNSAGSNPIAQFADPEGAAKARAETPALVEQLQKIKQQKAAIAAGHTEAETLGLSPGEVSDEATQADRVSLAQSKALKGDLKAFQGLAAVKPEAAAAIQDQVHEAVKGHMTNAQLAFDSLAGMKNAGQYDAKLKQLRTDGTLTDLEALGMQVPKDFDTFSAVKGREGQALRQARQASENLTAQLEARANGEVMEKKEAEGYKGRLTTSYGDELGNGTWSRVNGKRAFSVNGQADVNDLGKKFTYASPDQRKAILEDVEKTVPKAELEKNRAFGRTYQLATHDDKGNPIDPNSKDPVNSNPNVQQGIAEGLASMLRGGAGGANVGLLKIETSKRGFLQGLVDKVNTEKAAVINELKGKDVQPYLSHLTGTEIRDVLDAIKQYNDTSIGNRLGPIAKRAGALGLDETALGFGPGEASGVKDQLEAGRQDTIARFKDRSRPTAGGDGAIYLDTPPSLLVHKPDATQPGPVPPPVQPQQSAPLSAPGVGVGGGPSPAGPSGSPGGGQPPAPITIAGQSITPNLPPGVSPSYVPAMQRIESGNEKNPWTATTPGSSASGAFQMVDKTWNANKPDGAPARAKDATPEQQVAANDKLMATNAAALQRNGLPVNDVNMYVAHNLGEGAGPKLLTASPGADARSIVGEEAAKNNSTFFKGRPTVATVLGRYQANVAQDISDSAVRSPVGATAEAPGFMTRVGLALSGARSEKEMQERNDAEAQSARDLGAGAVDNAPAIGGVAGNIMGMAGGVPGAVAGGMVGGAAGQSFKDWMQGTAPTLAKTTEAAGYGAVGGLVPEARPVLGAVARVAGSGGVSATVKAMEGGDAADITIAGAAGAGGGILGEGIGQLIGRTVRGQAARELGGAAEILADPHATSATRQQAMQVARHYDVSEQQLVAARDSVQSGASRAQASLPGGAATDATASQRIAPAVQQEHNAAQHGYGVVEDALATAPVAPGARTNAVMAATRAGMDQDPAIMSAARRLDATTENASGRNPLQQYEAIRNVTSGIKASARSASGLTKQGLDQAAQLGDRVKELHLVNTLGTPEGPRMLNYARRSDAMWRDLKTTVEDSDMLRAIGQGDERTSLGSALLNVVKIGHAGEDAALQAVNSINRITENSPAPRQAMQELYMREAMKGAHAVPDIEAAAREVLHGKSSGVARALLTPEQMTRMQYVADHAAEFATKRKGEAGFESALMAAEGAHIVGHALPGAGLASAAFSLMQLRGNVRMFLRSLPPNYRDLVQGGRGVPGFMAPQAARAVQGQQ